MAETARTLRSVICTSAALLAMAALSACSSAPDWVDPTSWMGSSSEPATSPEASDKSGGTNGTAADGKTVAEASDQYPALADTPDKAPPGSTSDEQKQVAEGLTADRSQAQYSADALRGGAEPAAAPPPPPAPPQATPKVEPPSTAPASTQSAQPSEPSPEDTANNGDGSVDANPDRVASNDLPSGPAPMPGALPSIGGQSTRVATATPPAVQPAPSTSAAMTPAPKAPARSMQVAALPPPSTPIAAPVPTATPARPVAPSDAVLGFQASHAPALDPTVAQFVAPAVLAHYERTAAMGNAPGIGGSIAAPGNEAPRTIQTRKHAKPAKAQGSGSVVANLESLPSDRSPSAVSSNGAGEPPTAIVFFPHDTIVLDADARAKIQTAVQAFRASGGTAYLRVVGHSSSEVAHMSADRHLVYNFERSQARATAVARELIKEGVPGDKVLVEAVGDSEPLSSEAAPRSQDGSRRAEIFLQS